MAVFAAASTLGMPRTHSRRKRRLRFSIPAGREPYEIDVSNTMSGYLHQWIGNIAHRRQLFRLGKRTLQGHPHRHGRLCFHYRHPRGTHVDMEQCGRRAVFTVGRKSQGCLSGQRAEKHESAASAAMESAGYSTRTARQTLKAVRGRGARITQHLPSM